MYRICTKCSVEQYKTGFYTQSSYKDNLTRICKTCKKQAVKVRFQINIDANKINKNRSARLRYHTNLNIRQANSVRTLAYHNKRSAIDINFRLRRNLRSRLYYAIKNQIKVGSSISDLGCSIEQLKCHLEAKFQPGMNWDNHGKWHIDHIIPLSSFDLQDKQQFLIACNYSNLQPLWAFDNQSKNNRI